MAPFLRDLLLLSTLLAPALSVPTTESSSPLSPRPNTLHSPSRRPSGPFRRLRDAIIESIWSIPSRSSHQPCSTSGPLSAPENFRARYGGDVVLRFRIKTADEAKALSDAADLLFLDIWDSTSTWMDLRIAKEVVPSFVALLPPSLHGSYTSLMHDLARAVYDTYPQSLAHDEDPSTSGLTMSHNWRTGRGTPHELFFQDYQPLSVLYPWLRLLASLFPGHASLTSVGLSADGRNIPALRVGARLDDTTESRPTVLIVGGAHAREWISVSTAAYIAYTMVTRYGNPQFPHVTKVLDHFDLVFVPVLNPDGYEYTWTTDRLWRKNRQATSLSFCPGIDLDRAFQFEWDGHGNSDNACSDDYAGPEPLAAVEAQRLTEWAHNQTVHNNVSFVSYLGLHSYSQSVLYPFSYTCDTDPPNLEDLEEVALGLAKSFRLTHGRYYGVDSACEGDITLEGKPKKVRVQNGAQGGSALDYFYHDLGVKLAFQIKLRDTGTYGFLLPRSNILPTGEEAYESVLGLGRWLLGNHGIESIDDPQSVWGHEDPQPATAQKPVLYENEEYEWDDRELEPRKR